MRKCESQKVKKLAQVNDRVVVCPQAIWIQKPYSPPLCCMLPRKTGHLKGSRDNGTSWCLVHPSWLPMSADCLASEGNKLVLVRNK